MKSIVIALLDVNPVEYGKGFIVEQSDGKKGLIKYSAFLKECENVGIEVKQERLQEKGEKANGLFKSINAN
jgi:hypothetical protein